MRYKRPLWIVVLAALLAALGGTYWWYADGGQRDPSQLILYGNVDVREVELAFDAAGRIERVDVEEGDHVEKGHLLAVLEDDRFRHEFESAEAQEDSQRHVVAELEAGTRPQNLRKAHADVQAAKARLEEARQNRDRIAALVPTSAASQQQLDDAQAAYDTATAELRAARAALDLARAGPRKEKISAARARLEQFKAQTALAQWAWDETKLMAPRDGVIRNRILEPGDMATQDRPAFTLSITDPIWVRAYVPEPDLGKLAPGMAAWVRTDSFPEKWYEGWIGFISPTAEFTPKSVQTEELRTKLIYEVRVYVPNPQGELRLGMPATVIVRMDSSQATHSARSNKRSAGSTSGPAASEETNGKASSP